LENCFFDKKLDLSNLRIFPLDFIFDVKIKRITGKGQENWVNLVKLKENIEKPWKPSSRVIKGYLKVQYHPLLAYMTK